MYPVSDHHNGDTDSDDGWRPNAAAAKPSPGPRGPADEASGSGRPSPGIPRPYGIEELVDPILDFSTF